MLQSVLQKMSTVINSGGKPVKQVNPNTELKGSVGHEGTICGNPGVDGEQLNIPCTIGVNGTLPAQVVAGAGPQALRGVFCPADMGVGALSLPREREGVATQATLAEKALNANPAIIANASASHATTFNATCQIPATKSHLQHAINLLPACHNATKDQARNTITTAEDLYVPENDNYKLYLSPGAPISPIGNPQNSTNNYFSSPGELPSMAILEIPRPNSDDNLELILNSILSFTNKCLADHLDTKKIIKLLTSNYAEKDLIKAWELSRSLLEKKDRPKRGNVNYDSSPKNLKINLVAKQIVKMVRILKKSDNKILASTKLNIPMIYGNKCVNAKKGKKVNSKPPKNTASKSNINKSIFELLNEPIRLDDRASFGCQVKQFSLTSTLHDTIDCELTCCLPPVNSDVVSSGICSGIKAATVP